MIMVYAGKEQGGMCPSTEGLKITKPHAYRTRLMAQYQNVARFKSRCETCCDAKSTLIAQGSVIVSVRAGQFVASSEMSDEFLNNEFEYVANKLDFSKEEFTQIFNSKNKTISDYKSKKKIIDLGKKVLMYLGIEKRMYR